VFLRRITAGGADRSYGIYVAQLAGLPARIIHRAQAVLEQLEQPDSSLNASGHDRPSQLPQPHPIIEEVKQIDLFSMTPLDALNRLAALQRMVQPEDHPQQQR
jgi:DNA mismatch repair protein MutS